MLKIAHRGFSAVAPENTLAAFSAALTARPDGVEFDVHLSADGIPVVIHDHLLARTTNGEGEVSAYTLQQLKELDAGSWQSPAFAGERIPTARETLELLRGKTTPYIELKSAGTAEPVVALLQELQMTTQVVVMSFSEDLLRQVRDCDTRIVVRLLLGVEGSDCPEDAWRTAAGRAGVKRLAIIEQALTQGRLSLLHAEGYDIIAWTVDDEARMSALIAMGIEGIITNRIDVLMRA